MLGKRSCKIWVASEEVCKQISEKRLWPFSMWFCLAVIFICTSLGTSKSCNILQLLNRCLLLLEAAKRIRFQAEGNSDLHFALFETSLQIFAYKWLLISCLFLLALARPIQDPDRDDNAAQAVPWQPLFKVRGRYCNKCRWQSLVSNCEAPVGKGLQEQRLWL